MPPRGYRFPRPVIGDPSDREGMAATIGEYVEWMRIRNYSERTIEQAEKYLRYFAQWCEERAITKPREVTRPVVERYQKWLHYYRKANGEGLTVQSRQSRLQALRPYFSWLTKNNRVLYNPAAELQLPRPEYRLPKYVLTAAEAELILQQVDIETPLGLRDRAIMETLYSTGIRRLELTKLKMGDIDLNRGIVIVRGGKGRKDRIIPIGDRAVRWIKRYLIEVRAAFVGGSDEEALFVTAKGEPVLVSCLTHVMHRYIKAANINKGGSCHVFRHTCATLMLEGGADIRYIQQMLGHKELSTTEIYTQVSIQKLKEVHSNTHPSSQIKRRTKIEAD